MTDPNPTLVILVLILCVALALSGLPALIRIIKGNRRGDFAERLYKVEEGLTEIKTNLSNIVTLLQSHIGTVAKVEGDITTALEKIKIQDTAAGGAYWQSKEGYVVRVRDMSLSHLISVIEANWGSAKFRVVVVAELDRRELDRVHMIDSLKKFKGRELHSDIPPGIRGVIKKANGEDDAYFGMGEIS